MRDSYERKTAVALAKVETNQQTKQMSVRAYRVLEIRREEDGTFNLWHDSAITDWLRNNTDFFDCLNSDGCGIASVSVEDLQRMMKEISAEVDVSLLVEMQSDIAWAQANGQEWINYDCF